MSDRHSPGRQYVAIALVACAVLLFEILVTRILSVTLSYHFACLTISLAMLGLAAPGVWFSLEAPRPGTIFAGLYASALVLPGAVLAIVHLGDGIGLNYRGPARVDHLWLDQDGSVAVGCYLLAAVTVPRAVISSGP